MGVVNGQAVNSAVTNAAFLNKNQNDSMGFQFQLTKLLSLGTRTETSTLVTNLDTTSPIIKCTGSAAVIQGATAPATYTDGAIIFIQNQGTNFLTIRHENASPVAANRFQLPGNTDVQLAVNQGMIFVYDSTQQRWQSYGVGAGTVICNNLSTSVVQYTGTTYNIGQYDSTILIAGTTGVITATLPTAVGITGRQYVIKRTGTGATSYTLNTTSSQTIDASTSFTFSAQYSTVIVQAFAGNWNVIAKF